MPNNTLNMFACNDDYSFGLIQSSLHWGSSRTSSRSLKPEGEAAGETIQGPRLPKVDGHDLDPKDLRWFSTDCIEPPPLPGLEDADG
ncbi:MAG: hypothetical protein AAF355_01160 [Myxococcota bacterium]